MEKAGGQFTTHFLETNHKQISKKKKYFRNKTEILFIEPETELESKL